MTTDQQHEGEPSVWVRRHWNDWRRARYRLQGLSAVHWSEVSGGTTTRAPRMGLYGYVWCDAMLEGDLSHSCQHGPAPHRIKVCIVAKDNAGALMKRLRLEAGAKPDRPAR